MVLPSKAASASNICLKDKKEIAFDETKNWSISKNFFSSLAQNLVSKLPSSRNTFTESKFTLRRDNIKFKGLNFEFFEASLKKMLNILKILNPFKVAGWH